MRIKIDGRNAEMDRLPETLRRRYIAPQRAELRKVSPFNRARYKSRRLPFAKLSNEDLMVFVKNGWRVRSSALRTVG